MIQLSDKYQIGDLIIVKGFNDKPHYFVVKTRGYYPTVYYYNQNLNYFSYQSIYCREPDMISCSIGSGRIIKHVKAPKSSKATVKNVALLYPVLNNIGVKCEVKEVYDSHGVEFCKIEYNGTTMSVPSVLLRPLPVKAYEYPFKLETLTAILAKKIEDNEVSNTCCV